MTRIGLYPGSFDPVTFGHVDIVRRADEARRPPGHRRRHPSRQAGAVHGGRAREPWWWTRSAPSPTRPAPNSTSPPSTRLTVDAAREVGADVIIRGLRDAGDFDYEMQMAGMNARHGPGRRDGVPGLLAGNALHRCESCPPDRRHGRRRHRLRAGLGRRRLERGNIPHDANSSPSRCRSAPGSWRRDVSPSARRRSARQRRAARSQGRARHHSASARPRAEACRAGEAARARRLLQRHRVPSRHPRLHGADRRPDRHRHRRLEISRPSGRVHQQGDLRARHDRRGAVERSRTAPTASSSSTSRRRPASTGNIRSGAR